MWAGSNKIQTRKESWLKMMNNSQKIIATVKTLREAGFPHDFATTVACTLVRNLRDFCSLGVEAEMLAAFPNFHAIEDFEMAPDFDKDLKLCGTREYWYTTRVEFGELVFSE